MASTEVPAPRIVHEQEIGLRLPNGVQVFPPDTWHDHPLATAADRETIVGLIRAAAVNLGYEEDHFLPHYAWATREKISAIVYEQGDELPILATGYITEINTDESELQSWAQPWLNGEPIPEETLPNDASVG